MNTFNTLELNKKNQVAFVRLNRPEVHNALNDVLISELILVYQALGTDKDIRLIILQGNGPSFCAGGDLLGMAKAQKLLFKHNFDDSLRLAKCFYEIFSARKITLAIIHGNAFGGANGLIAACDFAVCSHSATFAFTEVGLGLIPATIAPYVIRKIGTNNTQDLMISARHINGKEAERMGLVNYSVEDNTLEDYTNDLINSLLMNAPKAQQNIKQLIHYLTGREINTKLVYETAEFIANARVTGEAQEGVKAFLEKSNPSWKEL